MIDPKFHIETDMSQDALTKKLKPFEPWRIGVSFSNGVNTADFETIQPFSDIPLNKLRLISEHAGEDWLRGKHILDIGSNIGYNSIILTRDFGCKVTGLEYDPRNIQKAKTLAELCGVEVDFQRGDAGTYCDKDAYDIILHLGTLYHLPDPVGALRCSAECLRPGGRIYIESAVYNGDDEYACRYIHGYGGDFTNYWALSPKVITEILEHNGLSNIELIRDFAIKPYEGTGMSRALFCAKKQQI